MAAPEALTGYGPGKVILLGEHAVVYGFPALAAPLSWGVTARGVPARGCRLLIPKTVTGSARRALQRAFERAAALADHPPVRVSVESDLPVSMGLGSSAALAVACARLLLKAAHKPTGARDVVAVALEMEKEFHGTPSGIDHTCSAEQRLIEYRPVLGGGAAKPLGRVRAINSRRPLKLLVALAGPRSPTQLTVAALRARQQQWPARHQRLFAQIGKLTAEGATAIETGDLEGLGNAMTVNHGLLCALQLSSARVDELVHLLARMGALGAKLTGAGGDGGAVIGLFLEPEPAAAKLTKMGITCFCSQIAGPQAL